MSVMRVLVSPWALIPCIPLTMAGLILAGLMGMAAEDFDREPTDTETALVILGFLPMYWFAAIMARLAWRAWRRYGRRDGHRGGRC